LLKAIAKLPEERYGTAQELASDLRRFLDDKPIQARRPTALQRLRKWGRRHQTVLSAVGLTLGLAAVALAISTILLWFQKQETNAALKEAKEQGARAEEQRLIAVEQTAAVRRHLLYVADMRLAYQAWQGGDLNLLLERLNRQIPGPSQEDLRG